MYSNLRRGLVKHWKFVTICGQTCGSGGIEMFGACQTACRKAWKPCAMVNGTIARKRDLWVRAVATRNALPYRGNLLGTKKKYHDPQTLAGSYLYNRHMQPCAFPKIRIRFFDLWLSQWRVPRYSLLLHVLWARPSGCQIDRRFVRRTDHPKAVKLRPNSASWQTEQLLHMRNGTFGSYSKDPAPVTMLILEAMKTHL